MFKNLQTKLYNFPLQFVGFTFKKGDDTRGVTGKNVFVGFTFKKGDDTRGVTGKNVFGAKWRNR